MNLRIATLATSLPLITITMLQSTCALMVLKEWIELSKLPMSTLETHHTPLVTPSELRLTLNSKLLLQPTTLQSHTTQKCGNCDYENSQAEIDAKFQAVAPTYDSSKSYYPKMWQL